MGRRSANAICLYKSELKTAKRGRLCRYLAHPDVRRIGSELELETDRRQKAFRDTKVSAVGETKSILCLRAR